MFNQKSIETVNQSRFGDVFIKPLYDSYCFSKIPQTIINLFSGETDGSLPTDTIIKSGTKYQKVILFFIDGFGWKFFEENYKQYPFLSRFIKDGVVSKITSQFPSTTPVHVTTMNTGLDVGTHGIYEWFYYEPLIDDIICPLPFCYASIADHHLLNIDPHKILPTDTIYQKLATLNIKSYCINKNAYAFGPYNQVVTNGVSEILGFDNLNQAIHLMINKVNNQSSTAYYYFYYGEVDAAAHIYGPNSNQFKKQIDIFFTATELFLKRLNTTNTALILTADHGHVNIYPNKTIYINQLIPDIDDYLVTNKQNYPIAPAGNCRDLFLHVKPQYLIKLKQKLNKLLSGKAEIYLTSDLIRHGFFGTGKPSEKFLQRVGSLVILSYPNESVWWYQPGIFEQKYYGHHGSLTRDEMEIPFLFLEL